MSRRWQAQSPDGIITEIPGVGIMSIWSSTTVPTTALNPAGYGPGCIWYYTPVSGPPKIFRNIGGNGYYVGATQNTTASWLEIDETSLGMGQFGLRTGTQYYSPGGVAYRTSLATAGIIPSAAGVDKIVDVWTLPAGVFDQLGRVIEFEMFASIATAGALTAQMKLIAAPTNLITWPTNPVPNLGTSNANTASKTDGSITVSGGTAIFDSLAISFNTSSADTALILKGRLCCLSTSAQTSQVTDIIAGVVSVGGGPVVDRTLTTSAAVTFVVTVNMQTTAADFKYNGMIVKVLN